MALVHLVLSLAPYSRFFGYGVFDERRRVIPPSESRGGGTFLGRIGTTGLTKRLSPEARARLSRRCVARRSALKATEVESGQIVGLVEIPVTCYQFLGLSLKAEKDEVVKAVMDLKDSEIEAGYTGDAIFSRQHLLMDIRDKLLFEPEYAGNLKENISPKSSLRIPWAWLPGALCLLQEVGEEKMVVGIGKAALEHSDVKPYVHDVLLSMALAECAIAKASFEKSKVYEGFEALARAQYLLKSKDSLGSMPLLSQIEESLEELAPACTLELLSLPHISDNAERRRGAIAALRELLRQGLDVETSCRVQDWHCFLSQALKKMMASEIVDLLSWENLASARKNKKLLESQNQKVVIDFDCFYLAMIAHLALGFSTRQMDLIDKAKTICECLIASEGADLKLEEALVSFLLGQIGEAAVFEKLQQLEINGNSTLQSSTADIPKTEVRDKQAIYQSLEKWLKDAALSVFPDTRECASSLANFFGGPKRILNLSNKKIGTSTAFYANNRSPSFGLSRENTTFVEHSPIKLARHMGEAVKQLAPVSLQTQSSLKKANNMTSNPSNSPLKRSLNLQNSKFWESWSLTGDILGRIACTTFVGCVMLGVLKMLSTAQPRISHMLQPSQSTMNNNASIWTFDNAPGVKSSSFIDKSIFCQLKNLLALFKHYYRHPADRRKIENPLFIDNLSSLTMASAVAGTAAHRRKMPLEEAESLVKQWQDIKAEALGPDHQIDTLSEILSESMLSKDLASSAKKGACFWRFVLLKLSILRADIVLDELGAEVAEVEAVLEEAAELVKDSQPRRPSYYSTYKVQYMLKKQDDGSWRFCSGGIESST
ncbi:plastid division protein CDP1, chloroplastic isoform X2 [Dendrobium catenatum]|uniref:plastid division protein CDP1, chloroplastic isoform X2 n=1 Tax=Dendrobium catenatum TaxID=906689 RepID=UPI0010A04F3A|nr:plastid division protein CDP1, chloroplastic isoform X2 [Dendrobium catenatum]